MDDALPGVSSTDRSSNVVGSIRRFQKKRPIWSYRASNDSVTGVETNCRPNRPIRGSSEPSTEERAGECEGDLLSLPWGAEVMHQFAGGVGLLFRVWQWVVAPF